MRPSETRLGLTQDVFVILVLAGALASFYALFKAVAILAGLPFP